MVTSRATTEMLNLLRDTIDTEVAEIAVGTDPSEPTKNDSALGNEVFRSVVDGSETQSQEVTHIMRILSSEANGNDLVEAGDSDGTGIEDRFTFASVSKTSDIEVEVRTKKTVRNP